MDSIVGKLKPDPAISHEQFKVSEVLSRRPPFDIGRKKNSHQKVQQLLFLSIWTEVVKLTRRCLIEPLKEPV